MKTILFIFSISGILISGSAFGQQDKKVEKARADVKKAEENLAVAKRDSAEDYNKYRNDAEAKIADNKVKIAELKAKKRSENKEIQEKYDKKVWALEEKNNELKRRLDGSGTVETSRWTSFKKEFNHDMNELGKALKDITVNNEK